MFNLFLKSFFVGVKGGADMLLLGAFVGHGLFDLLYFLDSLLHLSLFLLGGLLAHSVCLSLLKLKFLIVLQSRSELFQVFAEGVVFKGELVDCCAVLVDVVDHSAVGNVDVQLRLEPVVLFVQEVDLSLQFADDLLVLVLVVLNRKAVVVLATLVKPAQAQDFVVAGLNLCFERLDNLFK